MALVNGESVSECEDCNVPAVPEDFNDVPMFPPHLLEELEFGSAGSMVLLRDVPDPLRPAPSLQVRPLCTGDYQRGFMQLLTQLSTVGDVSEGQFLARYRSMAAPVTAGRSHTHSTTEPGLNYYVIVVEDVSTSRLAATGTLVLEQKFLHRCSTRARIEDIVVSDAYRGMQLGKVVVECLRLLGVRLGAYKASLECTHQLVPFYEQFGFRLDGKNNYMIQRYKD